MYEYFCDYLIAARLKREREREVLLGVPGAVACWSEFVVFIRF